MNRDKKINSLRPDLSLPNTDKKPLELFQNEILRPILKLQHDLTLSLLSNHKNYKPDIVNFTRQQYDNYITKYIQTNLDLRNQLLGSIIALFTSPELELYLVSRKELNKRIIQMQMKRFVDTAFPESQ